MFQLRTAFTQLHGQPDSQRDASNHGRILPPAGLDRPRVSPQVCREREFVLTQPKGPGDPGKFPGLPPEVRPGASGGGEPGWAGGLRKLYNSVVKEPLPDSFKDLLKKLDDSEDA